MKKISLIGKNIDYSFSPLIHNYLLKKYNIKNSVYELYNSHNLDEELENMENLQKFPYEFMNVTIPYKEEILQIFKKLEEENNNLIKIHLTKNVDKMGSTNCISIKKEENKYKIHCENTDILALDYFNKANKLTQDIDTILILGNGQTGKMCYQYFKDLDSEINLYLVTRIKNSMANNVITYEEVDNKYFQNQNQNKILIINTTPLGQGIYQNQSPLSQRQIKYCQQILDFNYNPYKTLLQIYGKLEGKKVYNGLDILIYQAIFSFEKWFNLKVLKEDYKELKIQLEKELISNYLIYGMPLAGKTTLFNQFSQVDSNNIFLDLDTEVEAKVGNINNYIIQKGIEKFRDLEHEILLHEKNKIIFCGGGTLDSDNDKLISLMQNNQLVFLDISLEELKSRITEGEIMLRPLINTEHDLEKLYTKRYQKFLNISDIRFENKEKLEDYINENTNN